MVTGRRTPYAGSRRIILRKGSQSGDVHEFFGRTSIVKKASLVVAGILTVGQFYAFRKKGNAMKRAGLVLGTAGAWSNTWDRWTRGYVVDYVGFQTPVQMEQDTYNLGDFFLVMGSVLFLAGEWKTVSEEIVQI